MANVMDMDNSIGTVMVSEENDLQILSAYPPGTIAFTPGYKKMWQLGLDGETWVDMLEAVTSND
jgi:hypothetical protein